MVMLFLVVLIKMQVTALGSKDASHRLGQVATEGFKKVWHSEPYNRFRKLVLKSRSNIDICTNCTEGTKVWT